MGYSKRQFVTKAFEELGLADYVYDISPEELQSAVEKLDAMMAAWNALGVRLGYPITDSPQNASLTEASGVPDSANIAIITNLAIMLAPSYGKQVMPDTKITAKTSYNTLVSRSALSVPMQYPSSMPAGAGNKPWRYDNPFLNPPTDPLLAGQDSELTFE